MQTRIEHFY